MDAVELGRQAAAELHLQAVGKGLDPWQPYAFVVAVAQQLRGLDVERALSGATLLNRARATFIAADRLILHENAGTSFEQAFLVAHEIGHEMLGDDSEAEHPPSIDPARSSEPSPVGLDRVIDYSRRQRREVQMDLFARELLLPRSVARQLHLEGNMTASAIAERLVAPFDVVAQQLFDALLLPPIVPETAEEKPQRPLNDLQAAAAMHRGDAYLLEAGPGTGKTQTLSGRVERLIEEGADPRRILLLTFSNKAAAEMAERISLKHKDSAAAMWIGTFHAFGLDIIRRFHVELALPKDPHMMDRTEAVELLEEEFPRLGLTHYRNFYDPTQIIADILAAISRAKDEVVDAGEYLALAAAMHQKATVADDGSEAATEARELAECALEVARVYEAYEELKRQQHRVDFGDLVLMPVQLLEANAAIRGHLQAQYDHVLVDEYQDVNRSSVRLLEAIRPDGRNLWAVGDAKQSIYRFRGASSFNMARFGKEDFAGGLRGRLQQNYRSVTEVVTAFSAFAAGMKVGGMGSDLDADRGPSGHNPEIRTVDRAPQQTAALADTIEEMRAAGHRYCQQAVLCTGNEKLSDLGQALERLGVPVLFLGSLFERPEIKDLFALLTVLTDRRAMGLVRVACWPEFSMTMSDVAAVLDYLRSADRSPGEWLQAPQEIAGLSEEGHAAVAALANALRSFSQSASPWHVLSTLLLDRTRYAARIAQSDGVADRTRGIAIWQLMNFIRGQPGGRGLPIVRLLDRVRRLVRLGDERDLRQLPTAAQGIDAVRLMTIHGAKGLEFEVVHIPGMNGDTLPRTPRPPACPPPDGMVKGGNGTAVEIFNEGQAEEQGCLFYVALSRARDRLFIYAPTQKANGHRRALSSFLDRLGAGVIREHVAPVRSLLAAPEAADIELAVHGELKFSAAQIALYESCPRRFFYTHILQIGGRRTVTPFMQMHDALRTVFQTVIASEVPVVGEVLDQAVDEALSAHGLSENGYLADYRAFATALISYFASIREGHTTEAPTELRLTIEGEQITIRPDDVLVGPGGARRLRRVQTGHRRSDEDEDVGAAAFVLAAQEAFPDAIAELVHLSDRRVTPIELSPRQLKGRRDKLSQFLKEIRRGRFPAKASAWTCPSCPAFFVCGATPGGVLERKF
jgi:superfamily I DNA/RNA helicase/Zn-dependent peptidase ImmA (M78 family)